MENMTLSEIGGWVLVGVCILVLFTSFYSPQTMAKVVNAGLSLLPSLKTPSHNPTPIVDANSKAAIQTYAEAIKTAPQKKNPPCIVRSPNIQAINEYGVKILSSQQKAVISLTLQTGTGAQLLEQIPLDVQVWTIDAKKFKECYLNTKSLCSTPPERLASPETNINLASDSIGPVMLSMGSSGVAIFKQTKIALGNIRSCAENENGLSQECFSQIESKATANNGLRWCA